MSIETAFYCAKCGAAMCNNVSEDYTKKTIRFTIDPCKDCLQEADDEGYKRGMRDATIERKGGIR